MARSVRWRAGASRAPPVSRRSAAPAGPGLQPRQQRPRRQQLDPRGGELQRQREPVQAGADRRHGRGVGGGDPEPRPDGPRPRDEQPRRVEPRQVGGRRRAAGVGERQRRDGELVLPGQAERRPAGRQDGEAGAGDQQLGHRGRPGQQVLHVVQEEQGLPAPQAVEHAPAQRAPGRLRHAERPRHRREQAVRVRHRRQRHEPRPVRERGEQVGRHAQRQPGLPAASGAGERDEAGGAPPQEGPQRPHLAPAPDEAGERRRQGVGRAGVGGRWFPRRWAGGHGQDRPVRRAQAEGPGQQGERARPGRPGDAALQVADGAGAEPRPLGQALLGQPGAQAEPLEGDPERRPGAPVAGRRGRPGRHVACSALPKPPLLPPHRPRRPEHSTGPPPPGGRERNCARTVPALRGADRPGGPQYGGALGPPARPAGARGGPPVAPRGRAPDRAGDRRGG